MNQQSPNATKFSKRFQAREIFTQWAEMRGTRHTEGSNTRLLHFMFTTSKESTEYNQPIHTMRFRVGVRVLTASWT